MGARTPGQIRTNTRILRAFNQNALFWCDIKENFFIFSSLPLYFLFLVFCLFQNSLKLPRFRPALPAPVATNHHRPPCFDVLSLPKKPFLNPFRLLSANLFLIFFETVSYALDLDFNPRPENPSNRRLSPLFHLQLLIYHSLQPKLLLLKTPPQKPTLPNCKTKIPSLPRPFTALLSFLYLFAYSWRWLSL